MSNFEDSDAKDEKGLPDRLPFSPEHQDAVLGHLLVNDSFFLQCVDRIEPRWFNGVLCQKIWSSKRNYYKEHKRIPTPEDVFAYREVTKEGQGIRNQIKIKMEEVKFAMGRYRLESIQSELTDWLHSRIYMEGVYESKDHYNRGHFREAYSKIEVALRQIRESSFDADVIYDFSNPAAIIEKRMNNVAKSMTFGHPVIDKLLLPEGNGRGCLLPSMSTTLVAPVNVGKCHSLDTPVIMADGTTKMVQEVAAGDFLMGPDEKPRKVLSTTKGRGQMFWITPKTGGISWGCNADHILNLKCSIDEYNYRKGETINIPLKEYTSKTDNFKNFWKLWRVGLNFGYKSLPIDPYILGAWLGDGTSSSPSLTTMDDELAIVWEKWIRSCGNGVSVTGLNTGQAATYSAIGVGKARGHLKDLNLKDNKHIPHLYLTSSRPQRLELLAGLIDTDGYLLSQSPGYEITQKNKKLADGIAYLARSLGFKVTSKEVIKKCQTGVEGVYYRMIILGNISEIPVKLTRKKGRDAFKDPLTTGFTVKPIGEDDYYGFTLEGDGLYLLGDFTVTHNTATMMNIIVPNLWRQKHILFIAHEGNIDELRLKFLQVILNRSNGWLVENVRNTTDPAVQAHIHQGVLFLNKYLTFMPIIRAGLTVEQVVSAIRRKADELVSRIGRPFDMVVDDYPAKLTTDEAREGKMEKRNKDEIIYMQFNRLAEEYKWHSVTAIQTNREGSKINRSYKGFEERLLAMEDVLESWGPMADTSNVFTCNRNVIAKAYDYMILANVKSRTSATDWAVVCESMFENYISHSEHLKACWYKGNSLASPENYKKWLTMFNGQMIDYSQKF